MRLDELIIHRHMATEAEVSEALDYQREFGGRLESHLYRFGYASEETLSAVLAEQFGFPAVCLSNSIIPDEVIRLVPADLAWSKLVLPFAFEQSDNTLKLACENPRRTGLLDDLAKGLPGLRIELFVALGIVLRSSVVRYYRDVPVGHESASYDLSAGSNSISVPFDVLISASAKCRILLFEMGESDNSVLRPMLTHQGFAVTAVRSIDELEEELNECEPDAVLLVAPGERQPLVALLDELARRNISVAAFPSYLVVSGLDDTRIGELLRLGFEEVFRSENVLDLLMIKLSRFRERLVRQKNQRLEILQTLGTHGSLQDMHVIDLLQAMGTTGKTAYVCVLAVGQQLSVYLDRGRIIYAECEDTRGPDALYQAIGWTQGVWSVDPIPPEALPEPNIFTSNEAILLEGCRRLDEANHGSSPEPPETGDPLAVFDSFS